MAQLLHVSKTTMPKYPWENSHLQTHLEPYGTANTQLADEKKSVPTAATSAFVEIAPFETVRLSHASIQVCRINDAIDYPNLLL